MMTITRAAADVIQDWLRGSSTPDPVVCLVQICNTPLEIEEARKRVVSRKELQRISLAALAKMPKYLYPAIYPRRQFLWLYRNIDGFRFAPLFAYPKSARRAMKTGVLDVAERGLVLKDANGTIVLPAKSISAL